MIALLAAATVVFLSSTVFLGVAYSVRDVTTVGRAEFDQLSVLARQAMDTALDLDARVRMLEGRPARPDSTVDLGD